MAAHNTQAELALKRLDGIRANGPSIRSANTVSMIGVAAMGDVGLGDRFV